MKVLRNTKRGSIVIRSMNEENMPSKLVDEQTCKATMDFIDDDKILITTDLPEFPHFFLKLVEDNDEELYVNCELEIVVALKREKEKCFLNGNISIKEFDGDTLIDIEVA